MKPARSLIPIGTATFGPNAARRVRTLESQLLTLLSRWGYREIILPAFEYLDVLSVGLAPEVLEKCYKFADWTTGRILVLRPDITAQIARMVAMGMGGAGLPLRLSYRTTVFRYEPEHAGREREIFQVGVELIGTDDAYADAEVLTSLIELLKAVGLPDFKVSVGHVGFYHALLSRSGLSHDGQRHAELAAARKDLPLLESLLLRERVSRKKIQVLLEAVGRCGQEDVLEWGRAVAGKDVTLRGPLNRLAEVYGLLNSAGLKEHLIVDLGEFRGFDYYDGVVFDVFTSSLGYELGGGGRYNHLLGRFGRDLPSTGFALDMDRVFASLDSEGFQGVDQGVPILLLSPLKHYGASFKLAQQLRSEGFVVIQETHGPGKIDIAKHARILTKKMEIMTAVLVGVPRVPVHSVMVMKHVAQLNRPQLSKVTCQQLSSFLKGQTHGRI